jgi:hypothetical protein
MMEQSQKTIESGSEKLTQSTYDDQLAAMDAMDAESTRYNTKISNLRAVAAEVIAAGGDEIQTQTELNRALDAAAVVHADNMQKIDDKASADKLKVQASIEKASVDLALKGIAAVSKANEEASQREADLADGLQAQLIAGDTYYTDAQKAELQKRMDEHRKQARAAFAVAKAARIAEATITTAMAVVNALNDGLATGGPAGLVVGPVAAAAAGVAGGIQIAAIAAEQPSFHQGYALSLIHI